MPAHADLPDDIDTLRAMLAERDAALAATDAIVVELPDKLYTRNPEIEHLKLKIAKILRIQFGRKY